VTPSSPGVLIDTSTIIELALHDPETKPRVDEFGVAAIEALVLFEQVYLDGRTVNAELPPFRWMDELDRGIVMVNNSPGEVVDTSRRGMLLANHVIRSKETEEFLFASPYGSREITVPARYVMGNSPLWGDIRGTLPMRRPSRWSNSSMAYSKR
jgi:hypothetical protein